ncbi:Cell division trigger factor [Cystobacter fuscus DSM 2262]|uniref:Cell division trigger factor n=1 Tax=Cystobacter fuscus (strain ATCC 25194 / DSM 2262 / NBRC 100088 / M29) TaxID=1242864 RepID=S9PD74_CYSF2|nr:peptidyl-prolyl cis-trans isomerase, FKBP-type domain protein [Cystobacter fuscus]EPX60247.1 Cell division trigger factor [Cystobacter fuscus DSM 2262]
MDSTQKPSPPAKKPFEVPLSLPLARKAAQGSPVQLPPVTAPSLEGLSITVPAPERITAQQIQERFQDLARAHATERMRLRTERIAWGDEVLLNLVGYSNGKLIPFSVRADVWVPLAPAPLLPGLYEQLVGHLPGETVLADILLSQDYPVEALRGQPARFAVQIQAAREVKFPDPASPEFLKAFGRGDTVEAATNSVLKELERETVALLRLQAQEMVLNEVAARTQVDIPEALVDEEIRRRWGSSEGRAVTELKFTEKQQEESLQTWLKDEPTRAAVRHRLRIGLALSAICARDGLTLTQAKVQEVLKAEAAALGIPLEQAAASLREEPHQFARIEQAAWHLMAVEYVMSKAQVRFAGA